MIRTAHSSRVSIALRASLAVVAVALGLVAGSPAMAQDDPYNPTPSVSVSSSDVCAGTSVIVTVSGLNDGDPVEVTFAGSSASLTAGSGGTASTTFDTTGFTSGTYEVVATTAGASGSASVDVSTGDDCDPDTPPTLSIADPAVCLGESAVATVSGGTPGSAVTITFAGSSRTVTLGPDGTGSTSFPTAALSPGEYTFVASGSGVSASAPMFVLDPDDEECAPPPPPAPTLSVSAGDTCVGQPLVVSVTGASGTETVEVTVAGHSATTTGSGAVSIPTTGIPAGTHDVVATSSAGTGASGQVTLNVGEDCGDELETSGSGGRSNARSGGGPLAFTGGNPVPLVVAGGAMVLGGAALVWRSRRKSTAL